MSGWRPCSLYNHALHGEWESPQSPQRRKGEFGTDVSSRGSDGKIDENFTRNVVAWPVASRSICWGRGEEVVSPYFYLKIKVIPINYRFSESEGGSHPLPHS